MTYPTILWILMWLHKSMIHLWLNDLLLPWQLLYVFEILEWFWLFWLSDATSVVGLKILCWLSWSRFWNSVRFQLCVKSSTDIIGDHSLDTYIHQSRVSVPTKKVHPGAWFKQTSPSTRFQVRYSFLSKFPLISPKNRHSIGSAAKVWKPTEANTLSILRWLVEVDPTLG